MPLFLTERRASHRACSRTRPCDRFCPDLFTRIFLGTLLVFVFEFRKHVRVVCVTMASLPRPPPTHPLSRHVSLSRETPPPSPPGHIPAVCLTCPQYACSLTPLLAVSMNHTMHRCRKRNLHCHSPPPRTRSHNSKRAPPRKRRHIMAHHPPHADGFYPLAQPPPPPPPPPPYSPFAGAAPHGGPAMMMMSSPAQSFHVPPPPPPSVIPQIPWSLQHLLPPENPEGWEQFSWEQQELREGRDPGQFKRLIPFAFFVYLHSSPRSPSLMWNGGPVRVGGVRLSVCPCRVSTGPDFGPRPSHGQLSLATAAPGSPWWIGSCRVISTSSHASTCIGTGISTIGIRGSGC